MALAQSTNGRSVPLSDRGATIRFAHVDGAGIVFYPRYVELIAAAFPELPLARTPVSITLEFLKANKLGERLTLDCDWFDPDDTWSVTGRLGADEHVKVTAGPLAATADGEFAAHSADFCAAEVQIGAWQVGADSKLQLARYYELISEVVEQWFGGVLQLPFSKLHSIDRNGIPTVSLKTRCRDLPALGDTVQMRIRPVRIGRRSFAFRSWLMRGSEWLVETDQIVVFVELRDQQFFSADLPPDLRARLTAQIDGASA